MTRLGGDVFSERTDDFDVRDTDIFIANYQALRDYAGIEISLYVQGQVTHADGGESFFQLVTGAAPGFYVDNNITIIVPTGGDGSSAWLSASTNITAEMLGVTDLAELIILSKTLGKITGEGIYTLAAGVVDVNFDEVDLELNIIERTDSGTLSVSNPDRFTLKCKEIRDTTAQSTRMLEVFNGLNVELSYDYGKTDGTPFYVNGAVNVDVSNIKNFSGFTQSSITTFSNPFELKSCNNVLVSNVAWSKCKTGAKIEVIATDDGGSVSINKVRAHDTTDTGLFVRLVAADAKFRTVNINDILMNNIGKSGVKFTAPSTATASELKNCNLSNIIITGYAIEVSSPALAVFRSASDTSIDVSEINISNVIIDGETLEGVATTKLGDSSGIALRYARGINITNAHIKNTAEAGIDMVNLNNCNISATVDNCGVLGTDDFSKAGVAVSQLKDCKLDLISNNNAGSGFVGDKFRDCKLDLISNDNAEYGLKTTAAGAAELQTQGNKYCISAKGNTLGFSSLAERVGTNHSIEVASFDDDGARDSGASLRRTAMSDEWSSGMFVGRLFSNIERGLEIFDGTDWALVAPILGAQLVITNRVSSWDSSDADFRSQGLGFTWDVAKRYRAVLSFSAGTTGVHIRLQSGTTTTFLVSTEIAIVDIAPVAAIEALLQQPTGESKITGVVTVDVYELTT